jgi:hypothetical protein
VNSILFIGEHELAQALRSQALAKAIANARSDADTAAAALNVTITGTQEADISQGYTPVVYSNYDAHPVRRHYRFRPGIRHLHDQLIVPQHISRLFLQTFLPKQRVIIS